MGSRCVSFPSPRDDDGVDDEGDDRGDDNVINDDEDQRRPKQKREDDGRQVARGDERNGVETWRNEEAG